MSFTSPRSLRRIASVAGLAALGFTATACPAMPGEDISHLSRWTYATFASLEHNTSLEIAAGIDDPAGAGIQRALEVKLSQSWCDDGTLVERQLSGDNTTFTGDVRGARGYADVTGTAELSGSETRTPAGPGCEAPQAGLAVTTPATLTAQVEAHIVGVGARVNYADEDGGVYNYQDGAGTGSLGLSDGSSFSFAAAEAAGTWLWQGYWADARGIDTGSSLPL